MASKQSFPEDFFFGAAASSYQYEGGAQDGGRGQSIWDTFTQRNPEKIKDGSNGMLANNSYDLYKEDVQILKKLGLSAYRFSFSWPRILPGGKLCAGVNRNGVLYYNNLINELLANGIEPYVTLFHWDLPQVLEDEYGGFLSSDIVADYVDYAEACFWEFGDRVKHWTTFNEPWSFSTGGYVNGTFPPGRGGTSEEHVKKAHPRSRIFPWHGLACSKGDPGVEPYIVTHNQLLAHAAAVELYKTKFQPFQEGKIGITLVSEWLEPLDDTSDIDKQASKRGLDFMLGWFMEPLTTGQYPQNMRRLVGSRLPEFTREQSEKLKKAYDFIGINYYTARYITLGSPATGQPSYSTDPQVEYLTERNGVPLGPIAASNWLYSYPKGIHRLLVFIKQNYNDPLIYITENGVDDSNSSITKARPDKMRIQYYESHLSYLLKAIDDGVNVKGYFLWSLMDNFEWADGYTVRFGIIHVDYLNSLRRYPKHSALWFANVIKKRSLNISEKRQIAEGTENTSVKRRRN